MSVNQSGQCHCGAVKFTANGEITMAALCHCKVCARLRANSPVHLILVGADAFKITEGEVKVSEGVLDHGFCAKCGCGVYQKPKTKDFYALFPINFGIEQGDKGALLPKEMWPTCHINYENRTCDVMDNLPKWETWPALNRLNNNGTPFTEKEKKGKKDKGAAKEVAAPQETKKEKAAREASEKAAKDRVKKEKACIKEGGKKGQDVEGMSAMGSKVFNVNLQEPVGEMDLLQMAFDSMNTEVDPAAEERKGGAGPFPKMIFSSGETKLSVIAHCPVAEKDTINLKEWFTTVCASIKGTPVEVNETTMTLHMEANFDLGIFPLKDRDVAIGTSFQYLRERNLVPEDDSDEEDYSGAAGLSANANCDY